ncbi:hypothetical protein HK098_004384 [Nowakowskiella sp. JEL0407]|nr:hypothetical protein HK098_004384 [Nowakowskiella sp. JEL0407]
MNISFFQSALFLLANSPNVRHLATPLHYDAIDLNSDDATRISFEDEVALFKNQLEITLPRRSERQAKSGANSNQKEKEPRKRKIADWVDRTIKEIENLIDDVLVETAEKLDPGCRSDPNLVHKVLSSGSCSDDVAVRSNFTFDEEFVNICGNEKSLLTKVPSGAQLFRLIDKYIEDHFGNRFTPYLDDSYGRFAFFEEGQDGDCGRKRNFKKEFDTLDLKLAKEIDAASDQSSFNRQLYYALDLFLHHLVPHSKNQFVTIEDEKKSAPNILRLTVNDCRSSRTSNSSDTNNGPIIWNLNQYLSSSVPDGWLLRQRHISYTMRLKKCTANLAKLQHCQGSQYSTVDVLKNIIKFLSEEPSLIVSDGSADVVDKKKVTTSVAYLENLRLQSNTELKGLQDQLHELRELTMRRSEEDVSLLKDVEEIVDKKDNPILGDIETGPGKYVLHSVLFKKTPNWPASAKGDHQDLFFAAVRRSCGWWVVLDAGCIHTVSFKIGVKKKNMSYAKNKQVSDHVMNKKIYQKDDNTSICGLIFVKADSGILEQDERAERVFKRRRKIEEVSLIAPPSPDASKTQPKTYGTKRKPVIEDDDIEDDETTAEQPPPPKVKPEREIRPATRVRVAPRKKMMTDDLLYDPSEQYQKYENSSIHVPSTSFYSNSTPTSTLKFTTIASTSKTTDAFEALTNAQNQLSAQAEVPLQKRNIQPQRRQPERLKKVDALKKKDEVTTITPIPTPKTSEFFAKKENKLQARPLRSMKSEQNKRSETNNSTWSSKAITINGGFEAKDSKLRVVIPKTELLTDEQLEHLKHLSPRTAATIREMYEADANQQNALQAISPEVVTEVDPISIGLPTIPAEPLPSEYVAPSNGNELTLTEPTKEDSVPNNESVDGDTEMTDSNDGKCVNCNTITNEVGNELLRCSDCEGHYHRECHKPKVHGKVSNRWFCNICIKE